LYADTVEISRKSKGMISQQHLARLWNRTALAAPS
jgi:hypothetical protein